MEPKGITNNNSERSIDLSAEEEEEEHKIQPHIEFIDSTLNNELTQSRFIDTIDLRTETRDREKEVVMSISNRDVCDRDNTDDIDYA